MDLEDLYCLMGQDDPDRLEGLGDPDRLELLEDLVVLEDQAERELALVEPV